MTKECEGFLIATAVEKSAQLSLIKSVMVRLTLQGSNYCKISHCTDTTRVVDKTLENDILQPDFIDKDNQRKLSVSMWAKTDIMKLNTTPQIYTT